MSARNTYVRPMRGWYRRNPRFMAYVLREGTSVFVALYALILLWGLTALSRGPEAYQHWLNALASPQSVLVHLVILAAAVFHAVTWFQVAPKATPPLRLGRRRVPDSAIIRGGMVASAVVTLVLIALVW